MVREINETMADIQQKDPFFEREARKYEKPIPSREYILQHLEERGRPSTFEHLVKAFALADASQQEALQRRLKAMVRDGQIMTNRRGSYALVNKMDLVRGRVVGHREGHGYVIPDEKKVDEGDIYLSHYQMRGVFPDDVVLVRIGEDEYRGLRSGIIVEVLEHNTQQVVGRYFEQAGGAFVEPEQK